MLALWLLGPCPRVAAAPADAMATVDDVFRRADRPPPVRDADLDRAAMALAADDGTAEPRHLMRAAGVYDGLVLPAVVVSPEDAQVGASWARYVTEQVLPQDVTHFGMARDGDRLAVVFVKRRFVLEQPMGAPREGRTLRIVGRLATGYAGAKAVMSVPDDRVVLLPTGHFGNQMTVEVPLTAGEGVYTVEIVAYGGAGTEVLALWEMRTEDGRPRLLPVRAASPPPAAPVPAEEAASGTPEQRLFTWINRERARLGLEPLRWDAALNATAAAHSEAMAHAGVAAHRLPGGRGPAERFERAGIRTQRFYENVAMARTLELAHEELWASPSHRLAMLDRQVDRVGIAVRTRPDADGVLYYVTEHFTEH